MHLKKVNRPELSTRAPTRDRSQTLPGPNNYIPSHEMFEPSPSLLLLYLHGVARAFCNDAWCSAWTRSTSVLHQCRDPIDIVKGLWT